MDTAGVGRLRVALRETGWWSRAQAVADVVRRTSAPGGLLVVGTPGVDPWHLTAHLADEAQWSGLGQLHPTLVRWAPPVDAPAHLAVGLERLELAGRGQTVLVVCPDDAPDALLERVDAARGIGANVVSLDGGDPRLASLAQERMTVSPSGLVLPPGLAVGEPAFDLAQHLVSVAAGQRAEPGRRWRDRLLTRAGS